MKTLSYNVGDLRRLVRESSQEFNPVLGPSVKETNKRNNEKSYRDSEKRAKDYDGGLTDTKKSTKLPEKLDGNRTTLDYNPMTEPDKAYKDKVKAQAKGYTSKLEQDNDIEKSGSQEYDDNGKILNNFEDARDAREKVLKNIKKAGLVGRELPDSVFDNNHLSESAPKPKRLLFKHTKFLNEAQVLNRIPEEYKRDGQIIYMKDGYNNEFMVECTYSNGSGLVETNIINNKNENLMVEQVDRINQLFNYKSGDKNNSSKTRVNEGVNFKSMLDLARNTK